MEPTPANKVQMQMMKKGRKSDTEIGWAEQRGREGIGVTKGL